MIPYAVQYFTDLQLVFTSLPGNVFLLLPNPPTFTIAAATDGMCSVSGRTREELIGKGLFESFPNNPDDKTKASEHSVCAALEEVLLRKKPNSLPVQRYDIVTGEGVFEERYWSADNKPVCNDKGEIIFIVHYVEDITEKIKAKAREAKIVNMEKENSLFMQAPVIVGICKGDANVIMLANEALLRLWDRSEDIIGKPLLEVFPEFEQQAFPGLIDKVRNSGETFYGTELGAKLIREGKEETRYFNFVYQPYYEDEKKPPSGVFIVAHDTTDMVVARKRVEESHRELQFVMDVMPQMVWQALPAGSADYFNKVYLDYTGLKMSQLIGDQWMDLLHKEDRANLEAQWQKAIEEKENYVVEHRLLGKDGRYRWFLSRGIPLIDHDGEVLKWYGTSTDIHDQKEISDLLEVQVMERTKELEIRNKELEQFTYVSHHDLQEPLRKILIFTRMVKDQNEQVVDIPSRVRLDKVIQSATRMSRALNDVLNYASLGKQEQFRRIDLNDMVASVLVDLEVVIGEKKAKITSDILPEIIAIPQQIEQLFYNLVNNSLKFSRTDETPHIKISSRILEPHELLESHPELLQDKEYTEISVSDNGIGFDQDAADGIFLMFQRLHSKEAYSGTGIGLAFCKKVILNHKGKIWARSSRGEGAAFTFLLPLQQE
jgi:PAS domain S-box-containing protein